MNKNSNIPFAPSSSPVFYGWVILIAGTVGMLMSIPGQTMGVSVFTENLIRDLSINRSSLSLAYLFGTVFSGLLIAWAGKLYDRHGARIMAFIAGFFLGLTLLYLTRIDRLAVLLESWIPAGFSTFILLTLGFWGIRFFGQGMLTLVSRNMMMKWFDKRRGFVNGIVGVFVSFGFSYAPKQLSQFIDRFEWQGTWTILSVVLGIGFVLFVLIFFRDNPADCNCKPDGNRPIRINAKRPPSLPPVDYTLVQARRTYAFWIITLTMSLNALYISGLTFHVVSVFDSVGMDKDLAIGIFLPASVIAIACQFIGGWISDYIRLKYLVILYVMSLLFTSWSLFFLDAGNYSYKLMIFGNGLSWGMYVLLVAVTWPRFFGLKYLGSISGYAMSWMVIGSALGPYLFSLSYVYTSSYQIIAMGCFILALVLFILSFRVKNPSLDPA